jgi:hypothetical protein
VASPHILCLPVRLPQLVEKFSLQAGRILYNGLGLFSMGFRYGGGGGLATTMKSEGRTDEVS